MHVDQGTLHGRDGQGAFLPLSQCQKHGTYQIDSPILKCPGHQHDLLGALKEEVLDANSHLAQGKGINCRDGADPCDSLCQRAGEERR